jgi:NADH/NAD ratio-sensing transcriptional regulator Rex
VVNRLPAVEADLEADDLSILAPFYQAHDVNLPMAQVTRKRARERADSRIRTSVHGYLPFRL